MTMIFNLQAAASTVWSMPAGAPARDGAPAFARTDPAINDIALFADFLDEADSGGAAAPASADSEPPQPLAADDAPATAAHAELASQAGLVLPAMTWLSMPNPMMEAALPFMPAAGSGATATATPGVRDIGPIRSDASAVAGAARTPMAAIVTSSGSGDAQIVPATARLGADAVDAAVADIAPVPLLSANHAAPGLVSSLASAPASFVPTASTDAPRPTLSVTPPAPLLAVAPSMPGAPAAAAIAAPAPAAAASATRAGPIRPARAANAAPAAAPIAGPIQDAPAPSRAVVLPLNAAHAVGAAAAQPLPPVSMPAPRTLVRTAGESAAPEPERADSAPVDGETVRAAAVTGAGPATPVSANGWGLPGPAQVNDQATVATLKLAAAPQQWQQPLTQALGEQLQLQLARNNEHAVIRLEPPMLGQIDISIRHAGGALQVSLSASNGDVVRQLHGIGDSLRHDLAQGQFSQVSVDVSATPRSAAAQPFGDSQGRQRQPGREQQEQDPGRALSEAGQASSTFAMQTERE